MSTSGAAGKGIADAALTGALDLTSDGGQSPLQMRPAAGVELGGLLDGDMTPWQWSRPRGMGNDAFHRLPQNHGLFSVKPVPGGTRNFERLRGLSAPGNARERWGRAPGRASTRMAGSPGASRRNGRSNQIESN